MLFSDLRHWVDHFESHQKSRQDTWRLVEGKLDGDFVLESTLPAKTRICGTDTPYITWIYDGMPYRFENRYRQSNYSTGHGNIITKFETSIAYIGNVGNFYLHQLDSDIPLNGIDPKYKDTNISRV